MYDFFRFPNGTTPVGLPLFIENVSAADVGITFTTSRSTAPVGTGLALLSCTVVSEADPADGPDDNEDDNFSLLPPVWKQAD